MVICVFELVYGVVILIKVKLGYVFDDGVGCFGCGMFMVGVFDLQQEFIFLCMGIELVEKCGMCGFDMYVICWGWCDVGDYWSV